MKRKPIVSGSFYPGNKNKLHEMIDQMVSKNIDKIKAIGVISPHAGYIYSGGVAAAVLSSIHLPKKIIILGPNHRGAGSLFALYKEGIWETPLGDVPIDSALAVNLMGQSELIQEDSSAHIYEHSLEVQIPFLQYFVEKISIVPISIASFAAYQELKELGKAIAHCIQASGKDILVLASTDMSHYISQEKAKEKDFLAIEKILKLDSEGLYNIVHSENISMCGFQPTVALIEASSLLGAKKAELIKYQTSGDVTGDHNEVVGYAGLRII